MLIRTFLIFILMTSLSGFVFAANQTNAAQPMTNAVSEAQKDSQAIDWLIVLNHNEINAAKFIQTQKLQPTVIAYASWLNKEHSENLSKTKKIQHDLKIKPQKK